MINGIPVLLWINLIPPPNPMTGMHTNYSVYCPDTCLVKSVIFVETSG